LPRIDTQAIPSRSAPAFDKFCRTHFAAVSTHPGKTPVRYTITVVRGAVHHFRPAASSNWHHWDACVQSSLEWALARPLIADACSALHRMDPLAMRR
jgi:hypothetical protein